MVAQQKDNFYRNLSTVLLSVIAIFGIFSIALLININSKLNTLTVEQAVQKNELNTLKEKVDKLEIGYNNGTKNKKTRSESD